MKRYLILLISILSPLAGFGQLSWQGGVNPEQHQPGTLLFDATGTPLAGSPGLLYAHTGVTLGGLAWQNIKGVWGNNSIQPQLTQISGNRYKLEIQPSIENFYNVSAGSINRIDIVVRNASGTLQTSDLTASVGLAPIISSFSPAFAKPGDAVVLTGSGFNGSNGGNVVFFGATKATVNSSSASSLTVTVPLGATYDRITALNTATLYSGASLSFFTPLFTPAKSGFTSCDLAAKVDFAAGSYPLTIALGDLDGDGKTDLAVANTYANTVSVFRNTSSSGTINTFSFSAKVDFYSGSTPGAVAIADLNSDGKPELVVANQSSNSVSVFRNNSSPGSISTSSFGSAINFSTGANPYSIAIGDLDGDGKNDLVVTNLNAASVSTFRNVSTTTSLSSSSFSPKVDFSVGTSPYSVDLGDLDGDGKADLVVANINSNTVSVLRNTTTTGAFTSSSFAPKVDFATGPSPNWISVADVDGDGKVDFATTNGGASSVSVFRNISSAGNISSSSFATKVDFLTESNPYAVEFADMDGDGKTDMVVSNGQNSTLSVFRNTAENGNIGSSSFSGRVDFNTGSFPRSLAAGDLDGDGKPDVVSTNSNSNTISVFRNTDIPSSPVPVISSFSPASGCAYQTTITISGSNFSDVTGVSIGGVPVNSFTINSDNQITAIAAGISGPVAVIRNCRTYAASQSFTVSNCAPQITSFSPSSAKPGETVVISGSGFSATAAQNTLFFGSVRSVATAATSTSITVTVPAGATYAPIRVLNSATALTGSSTSYFTPVFIPVKTGFSACDFSPKTDFTSGNGNGTGSVAIGDLDGDGKADMVVANNNNNTVSVFRNTSTTGSITSGSFGSKVDFSTVSAPKAVTIGDLDGDGKPELIVSGGNSISILRNTTLGGSITSTSFATKVDFLAGADARSAAIGDLDGDGKPEIVVSNYGSNTISVFRNTSLSGGFTASSFQYKTEFATGSNPSFASISDLDGDQKPDVVVSNYSSNTVSVYRNTSAAGIFNSAGLAAPVEFTTGTNPAMVLCGDVDGDGKTDLIVPNFSSNSMSIMRNQASSGSIHSGSFGAKADFTTGNNPSFVAITDLNGDAKPDLGILNNSSATASFFLNTSTSGSIGSGSFAERVDYSTGISGSNPTTLTFADLEGDGRPEMVFTYGQSLVSVLRNIDPAPPTIGSFSPSSGCASSAAITLTGTNLSGITSVSIGGLPANNFTVNSATQLTINASASSGQIMVSNYCGSATSTGSFEAQNCAPVVTSISPVAAKPGETMTITGSNFNASVSQNVVTFGSMSAAVSAASTGSLSVTVPSGAAYGPVSVLNSGTSLSGAGSAFFIPTFTSKKDTLTTCDFLPKLDFSTGYYPSFVAIGDLDGDGKPDLAVTNQGSSTVSVFRNTSTSGAISAGSFAAKVDFTTGTTPFSVAIGDLDGDGKPDLAVTNVSSNTVSVFRNTSVSGNINSSSFAARVDFATGINPYSSVAIGDLDGDGKPDLAVANAGSNTVSVLRNTSISSTITASSFASKVDFATGNYPYAIAIGDLDGDGKSDMAVTNLSSNSVSVFRNTSAIGTISASSFAGKVDFTTGSSPYSVSIGDLDSDGKLDLAVANAGSSSISVYRNTASSGALNTTSFSAKVDISTGAQPYAVTIADVTGDGKPDLVSSNQNNNSVSIIRNKSLPGSISTGSFAPLMAYGTGANPKNVAACDLDGDGLPELLTANSSSNSFSVLKNKMLVPDPVISGFSPSSGCAGTSTFTLSGSNFSEISAVSIGGVPVTSFTVNSETEIVVTVDGITGPVGLTKNCRTVTSSASFTVNNCATTIASVSPLSGKAGDAVTITGTYFNTVPNENVVFFGAVRATVSAATASSLSVTVPMGATYAPVTVLNAATRSMASARNAFNPVFSPAKTGFTSCDLQPKTDFTSGSYSYSVAIGDLDGDGKADLAVANAGSNTVSVLRNTSISSTITASSFASKVDFTTGSNPYSVAIGDLDGDGKPDLAVSNYSSGTVSIFRNTSSSGSISFATKVDFTTGPSPHSVAIGDLDGDGKSDLAVTNLGSTSVSVFRNTSVSGNINSSSFAARVDFTTGSSPYSVAIGDLDGDGKSDLAVTNLSSTSVSVFRNTSVSGNINSSSFAARVDFTTGSSPYSVAIGDLDGDGRPDLVASNNNASSLSILRNTSVSGSITTSSFAPKADASTGSVPNSVAIGDLDGDGMPDLVVAGGSSQISIHRNGVPVLPTITGISPASVCGASGTITISGTNLSGVTSVRVGGTAVASYTINSDNQISAVVTGNSGVFSVSTYCSTVSGTDTLKFTNCTPTITAFTPAAAAPGASVTLTGSNFNSQTALNVVYFGAAKATVTSATANSLTVTVPSGSTYAPITVLNTVTGLSGASLSPFIPVYSPAKTDLTSCDFKDKVDFTTGSNPYSVAFGDIDGDGKPDMAVANSNSYTVSVYRNISATGSLSSSSFASKVDLSLPSYGFSVGFSDLDGDGKLDLVVANSYYWGSSNVSVFRNIATTGNLSTASFAPRIDLGLGSYLYLYHAAAGDLDGDGKPDLAVPYQSNSGSSIIALYRNTSTSGIISFASGGTLTLANNSYPYSVAIGDLDGDNKSDLAIANQNSNSISLFRNISVSGTLSTSSFATRIDFATGTNPYSLSIGDLDGDGKPELAVANRTSNTVSLFRNTAVSGSLSSSSFAAKVDLTTGTSPRSVSIADLSGDGKPDLAVANETANTVSIFRNTSVSGSLSSSSFAPKLDFPTSTNPYSVAVGDLDGDGLPELATANFGANSVSVLKNIKSDSIPAQPVITSFSPSQVCASINGNITISGSGFSSINSVTIGELPVSSFTVNSPTEITATINTVVKGVIRIANYCKSTQSDTLRILNCAPVVSAFSPAGALPGDTILVGGSNFNSSVSGNVVQIGAVKANVASASTSALSVVVPIGATFAPISVLNNTNGLSGSSRSAFVPKFIPPKTNFTSSDLAPKVDFGTGAYPFSVAIGDLDGDGKSDLAVANQGSKTVSVYRNTSATGSLTSSSFSSKVDFNLPYQGSMIVLADLDGDSKLDIIVSNSTLDYYNPASAISVFRNTATTGNVSIGSFAPRQDLGLGSNLYMYSVVAGDLDGDGKPDLAVPYSDRNGISYLGIYRSTSTIGGISFTSRIELTLPASSYPYSVAMGDLDGDGKQDLTVANTSQSTVSVFRNTSLSGILTTGSFAPKVDFATGTNPYSVAIGDLDGDGKPELAVANQSSNSLSVFRNISVNGSLNSNSFAPRVDYTTGSSPVSITIGNITGDGKPDLVIANTGSNSVSVFRNAASIGDISASSFVPVSFATGTNPKSVAIGDLDGDSKADLAVANNGSNTVSVFRNTDSQIPYIASFTPTSGCASTATLTINGANLAAATAVRIGGTNVSSFTIVSESKITATIGIGTKGLISIITPFGTASSEDTFTVHPKPTVSITPSGPTSFCSGQNVTLTASAGQSYQWTPGGQTTQAITVTQSGIYTAKVFNAQGCFATANQEVSVISTLPVTISASGPTTFCNGDSVTLTASGANGYVWNPGGNTTASIKVKTGGTYTVTGTTSSCTGTASQAVIVNTPSTPTISASGPLSFCSGGSVTLTSSFSSGNIWSNGGTSQSIVVNNSGSFSVKRTDANGCISGNSSPVTVSVSPAPAVPTITASGTTSFCQSGSVVLTSSAASGNTWSNGATSQSITVTSGGSYTVTTGTGCTSTSAATLVTVNPQTKGTFAAIPAFCAGSTAPILPLTSTNGITGTWNPQTVSNTASGTYIFTPSGGSCPASTSLPITVTQNVTPAFGILGPIAYGTTAPILQANSLNGISGTWNPALVSNTQTRDYTFTPNAGQCATPVTITIVVNTFPDLAVQNVSSPLSDKSPGDLVPVSWTIANTGSAQLNVNWTERIFIQTPSGQNRTQIKQSVYTTSDVIAPGQSISRTDNITLPQQITVGDQAVFVVEIVPGENITEAPGTIGNNTGVQPSPWNIRKTFTIQMSSSQITEGSVAGISVTVSRSGSVSAIQAFDVSLSPADRFSFPAGLNFPAGQVSRTFTLLATDNNLIEGNLSATLTASATGFQSATASLTIIEDDKPSLSITGLPDTTEEGVVLNFQVQTNLAPVSPLTVFLTSSNSLRFPVPVSVTIPAGQLSGSGSVNLPQDNLPEVNTEINITAGAANHNSATRSIYLTDDDIPGIELVFQTRTVSESQGFFATQATLRRLPGGNPIAFSVNLSASLPNTLILPSSVPLAANELAKTFTVGVVDDGLVNGERKVQVSAALYISSCGCSAPNTTAGYFQDTLKVLDNDGPTLTLSTPVLTLAEGQASAGLLRITRNTPTSSPLQVALSSSNTGEATLPPTATIPGGSAFIDVPITTINDNVTDGSKQVNLSATSPGFSQGSLWVIVTDINKPDLVVQNPTVGSSSLEAQTVFTYGFRVSNSGFAHNPAGVRVKGYLSKDNILDASDSLLSNDQISQPILTNEPYDFVNAIQAPNRPGQYKIIFQVNPDAEFSELSYDNNTSAGQSLQITPEYDATAAVDSLWYLRGTAIDIRGTATKTNGSPAGDVPVDIYIISNGLRRTFSARTDQQGRYQYRFQPLSSEVGSYTAGACFPGYAASETDDAFDILGVRINNGAFPLFKITFGDTLKGKLLVTNLSGYTIRNIGLSPDILPQGANFQFGLIPQLSPQGSDSIWFRAWGSSLSSGNNFLPTSFQVTCSKGNLQKQDAYYFCQARQAYIAASLNRMDVRISSSVGQKIVQFRLTNSGQGNSGQISVNLPQSNWLSSVSPVTIPNLGPGDTASVILRFAAIAEVPFGYPLNGTIGIQTANGNSFSIPFTFEKVSQTSGVVAIEATNQFTFFAAGSPKVAGATVTIRNYYTGQVYGQGTTDSSGKFYATGVPEGVHRLTVEKERHQTFSGNIEINPGDTVSRSVFLNYQAITINWNVEPTAIEDQYDITLTTTFETNIPMPVVVLDMPKSMPSLQGDQEYAFMATLINHGLITAKDVKLNLPQGDPEYEFVTNYTQSDLLALQSIQVPVIMRRRQNQGAPVAGKPSIGEISSFLGISPPGSVSSTSGLSCQDFTNYVYWYKCGSDGIWQQGGVVFTYEGRSCTGGGGGSSSSGLCWSCIGGGISYPQCALCPIIPGGTTTIPPPVETEKKNCKQCINDMAQAIAGCLGVDIPPVVTCAANMYADNTGAREFVECLWQEAVDGLFGLGANMIRNIPGAGWAIRAAEIADCIQNLVEAMETCNNSFENNSNKSRSPATIQQDSSLISGLSENLKVAKRTYLLRDSWTKEYFGDLYQNNSWVRFYIQIAPFVDSLHQIPTNKQDSILTSMTGFEIPIIQIQNFFTRWNNSIEARNLDILEPNVQYPGIINWIRIKQISDSLVTDHNYSISKGFAGVNDMHKLAFKSIDSLTKPQNQSVCASVKVQFSQTLTMTREAFRGTLDIFNGHPTDKMDSLSVNLLVTDANGVPSNGVFQINTEQLTNLSDVTGTGKINAQQNGIAKFLFIPELGAAPTAPKVYNFGGSVRYFDPYARAMVTLPLNPVTLTVNPSPNLQLHYFMQRDILGDDALTTPKVEPSIPAELAVMVENWGYGPAVNMTISSAQPKIVDNEKGLAINFNLIGSNFQGKPRQLGVTNINFGTISALKTRIGQWYFTSSLLGKFVEYQASVVHANSFGNPELSLIKGVKLHELTRSVRVYGAEDDTIGDFLVNDVPDIGNTPDILFHSQGKKTEEVFLAASGSFNHAVGAPSFTNILTLTASEAGWNFIKINDPGDNRYTIQSITRSDGQIIPLENAWLTFVTLPTAQEPVYENKFHFVDKFPSATTRTYTIVWGPKNNNVPEVVSISGTPATVTANQVSQVRVKFSKAINPTTFNWQDLDLVFQGGPNIASSAIGVTQVDTSTFDIDLSAVTTGNGTYRLIVQAAGVEDVYGITGLDGRQVIWTQFLTVPVVQAFEGLPEGNRARTFDSLYVRFNLPIDTTSINSGSFTLRKGNLPMPGTIGVKKWSSDARLFLLTGLDTVMTLDTVYTLAVDLLQIKSTTQVYGLAEQRISLTLDRTGPFLSGFTKSNTGGLDSQHFPNFQMVFNEPLIGFNTAAIELRRGSDVVAIPIDKLSSTDQKTWQLGNLSFLTYPDGTYRLKVKLSEVKDDLGNFGSGEQMLEWTVNRSSVLSITNPGIQPDLGFSDSDGVSSDLNLNLRFTMGAPASQVLIYQTFTGSETLVRTLSDVSAGLQMVSLNLISGGNTGLKVKATGTDGSQGEVSLPLFLDLQALQAYWLSAPSGNIFRQPDTIQIRLSSRMLQNTTAFKAALALNKNGVPLSTAALQVQMVSDTLYRITGLRASDSGPGNYQLSLAVQQLAKYSSGSKGNSTLSQTWSVLRQNQPPVANAGPDQTVTSGSFVQLNGSGSSDPDADILSYRWVAPAGITLNDSTLPNPQFSVSSGLNGTYNILLIVKDGSTFSSDVVQVVINITQDCGTPGNPIPPKPVLTASGPLTFCAGDSVDIISSALIGNVWNNAATTQIIRIKTAGIYFTRVSNGNCAVNSDTLTVTIIPAPPAPIASAGGATTFCAGGSVTLTSSAASGNLWSTGETTQSITISNSGTYTVRTIAAGCTSTVSNAVAVTVNPNPTTPTATAGGPTTFCAGGSVTLTSSAASGNLWSTGETTQSITISNSGTYTVRTIAAGCTSAVSNAVAVTVNPNPTTPTATAGGATTFCSGGSVTLNSNAATGNLWSTGETTQSITISNSGTYTVRAIAAGCTSAVSNAVAVTVNPTPTTPTATAGGPTTFCSGGSVTLTSNAATGNLWSTGETTQSITVSITGNYNVRTIAAGCTSDVSEPVSVTVNSNPSAPAASAGGATTFCAGGSVTLNSNASTGNLWSTGATTQSITVSNSGTYTVRAIAAGCTSAVSNAVAVTVNTNPVVNAGPDVIIQSGQSAVLNASGAAVYQWSPLQAISPANGVGASVTVNPTQNTTYTVTGTDGNNCTASDAVLVTVTGTTLSPPVITPGTGTYTGTQSVSISSSTTGTSIYYTTTGNTPVVGTAFTKLYAGPFQVNQTTTIRAMAVKTGSSNSSVTAAVLTITNPPQTVATPVISPGTGSYTGAQSVSINCATAGATIYYTTNGNVPSPGTSFTKVYSAPFVLNATATVRAFATNTGMVTSATALSAITITIPTPVVATPVITPGSGSFASPLSVSISCATPGATIYYTTNGNTPLLSPFPNSFTRIFTVPFSLTGTGSRTIRAIATAPGQINSAVAVANLTLSGGSRAALEGEEVASTEAPLVYPNPSGGIFNVQLPADEGEEKRYSVWSTDGKEIMGGMMPSGGTLRLDLGSYPKGLYQLKIQSRAGVQVLRMSKY